jgi:hypothetical protein
MSMSQLVIVLAIACVALAAISIGALFTLMVSFPAVAALCRP